MRELLAVREPIYQLADVAITSGDAPHNAFVNEVLEVIDRYLEMEPSA
jgi:shikimate kinase